MAYQTWLGADPGSSNFAVTVVRYCTETGRRKILYLGMIENPIKNLTETPVVPKVRRDKPTLHRDEPKLSIGVILFRDEIDWIIKTFGVTHFVGERFQARGRMMGDTIEAVSLMLGIIIDTCRRKRITFLTTIAGVWKSAIARQGGDLQLLYDSGIVKYQKALQEAGFKATKDEAKVIVHMVDSTLIALWHADKGKPWANDTLLQTMIALLIKQRITAA